MTYDDFIEHAKNETAAATLDLAREKGHVPEGLLLLSDLMSKDDEIEDLLMFVLAFEIGQRWLKVSFDDEQERCFEIAKELFPVIADQSMVEVLGRAKR